MTCPRDWSGTTAFNGMVIGEKSPFHQLSRTEGTAQADRNDKDTTENHHEIADAEQSQPSLIRQKSELCFGRRGVP